MFSRLVFSLAPYKPNKTLVPAVKRAMKKAEIQATTRLWRTLRVYAHLIRKRRPEAAAYTDQMLFPAIGAG